MDILEEMRGTGELAEFETIALAHDHCYTGAVGIAHLQEDIICSSSEDDRIARTPDFVWSSISSSSGDFALCQIDLQQVEVPFVLQDCVQLQFPDSPMQEVGINLINKDLWRTFHQHVNEMIMDSRGTNTFPNFHLEVYGLDPRKLYSIYLDFPLRDHSIWKYADGFWTEAGSVHPTSEDENYTVSDHRVDHHQSPNRGSFWLSYQGEVEFHKLKLVSNTTYLPNQVCLRSSLAYNPRVNVVELDESGEPADHVIRHFFPETAFIAVTSFNNTKIQELKQYYNPEERNS